MQLKCSSSVHIDNKKRHFNFSFWKRSNTRIRRATKKRFCLRLHYNGANSYLFVNGVEIIKFKAKNSEIIPNVLCLGNVPKGFSACNMKTPGLYITVYDFSADYGAISIDDILSIHKYLIKKTQDSTKCLNL